MGAGSFDLLTKMLIAQLIDLNKNIWFSAMGDAVCHQ